MARKFKLQFHLLSFIFAAAAGGIILYFNSSYVEHYRSPLSGDVEISINEALIANKENRRTYILDEDAVVWRTKQMGWPLFFSTQVDFVFARGNRWVEWSSNSENYMHTEGIDTSNLIIDSLIWLTIVASTILASEIITTHILRDIRKR